MEDAAYIEAKHKHRKSNACFYVPVVTSCKCFIIANKTDLTT